MHPRGGAHCIKPCPGARFAASSGGVGVRGHAISACWCRLPGARRRLNASSRSGRVYGSAGGSRSEVSEIGFTFSVRVWCW